MFTSVTPRFAQDTTGHMWQDDIRAALPRYVFVLVMVMAIGHAADGAKSAPKGSKFAGSAKRGRTVLR